ncbi:MAG: sugar phosphate isomerase/epimerase [Christensenellaceae bacterium]|nr:sugar phosphate isomerase/epimerase [Christensenellaceae bacterium]
MKHGIYYAYWEQAWAADYLYYVDKVAKLGFDILEIGATPLPEYDQKTIAQLRDCAKGNGIELTAGYGPAPQHNVGSTDPAVQKGALEWYTRLFKVMDQLDIRWIGGALYLYWPVDYSVPVNKEADFASAVAGMKKLGAIAADYGIDLGMEILNRFENYLLNTAKEGVEFVEQVGLPNVKVMLDTFHMNIEEESIGGAIRTAGKHLGHLHTGECNRMVPGKGRTPWKEIGEALKEVGYDGRVIMEPFVRMGGQVGQDVKVWRDLSCGADEAKLDQDAKEALIFQRYMLG